VELIQEGEVKFSEVAEGEGITGELDGRKIAAYKQDGELLLFDNTCTHMGCPTEWNKEDKTWDCPCHGSRFYYYGSVINSPATEPLQKLNFRVENDEIILF
jgi:Rieske Fe-S protein